MVKYDLIIVGGGPAGMSAALYAARQNLRFLLITETIGGLANVVPTLKTYLGFHYIAGFELVEKFKEHLKDYKVPTKNERVVDISKSKDEFVIRTDNKSYMTKTVIVASGRRFKKLNIPGEKEYYGKGVSECTACDGPMFKGKTVAVIGGGRTGLYATLYLLKLAKKIYLIEREKQIGMTAGLKVWADTIKKNKKVTIMTESSAKEIAGEKFVKEIVLIQRGKIRHLPVSGVFVEIGYEPNTEFVEELVELNDREEIIIDEECRTNVKGLFAAGDVTSLKEKQVAISVGEGAKATLSALIYLESFKE